MRNKISNDKKKKSITIKIDNELLNDFNKYCDINKIDNKSKFIEFLIYSEMKKI